MVKADVPGGVLPIVVMVSVEVPEVVIAAGLKEAVAPAGKLVALRPTVPTKPVTCPTATLKVVDLPAIMVWEPGVAAMVKSGCGTDTGMIWIPLTGALAAHPAAPGVAVRVSVEDTFKLLKRT